MSINELIWLMFIFFIIHECEEIIFAKSWQDCQGNNYKKTCRNIISASLLHMMACGEILIVLACILFSFTFNNYIIDFILFNLYFVHLIIHAITTIKHKFLTTGSFTAILSIPLCIYTIYSIFNVLDYSLSNILTSVIISLIITFINLSVISSTTVSLSRVPKKVTTVLHNK